MLGAIYGISFETWVSIELKPRGRREDHVNILLRVRAPDPTLDEVQFRRRFASQFRDPAFNALSAELERIALESAISS